MENQIESHKKAYIYASAKHYEVQQDGSFSIEAQRIALTQYAKANGFENYEFIVDTGYSGLDYDRPALDEIINESKDGNVYAVII